MSAWRTTMVALGLFALTAAQTASNVQHDATFDIPVRTVRRSPVAATQLALGPGETVAALDVATDAPVAAVAVASPDGSEEVRLWDAGATGSRTIWQAPAGIRISALVWHPAAPVLFMLVRDAHQWEILRLTRQAAGWTASPIFSSAAELSRLVISPRSFDGQRRLFFGQRKSDGGYRILSVTESGRRLYQVIGPKATVINVPGTDAQPTPMEAQWALPVSFHPAGRTLIWEDGKHCYESAVWGFMDWDGIRPLDGGRLCGGSLAPTPNGLGLLAWQPGTAGVTLYLDHGRSAQQQAGSERFLLPPVSTPDGRGIVDVVASGSGQALAYVPIAVPLADVSDAWMFASTPAEQRHFSQDAGLFRPYASTAPNSNDQLYTFYDSELYSCGRFDDETPTRPYLVTTDLIWEVYGAAYHGLFTITERQEAIPAFWRFVAGASAALRRDRPKSPWAAVFETLAALQNPYPHPSGEVERILHADGPALQPQFQRLLDYAQLRPRGFYTSDAGLQNYFRAFRYLTAVASLPGPPLQLDDLANLPDQVKHEALVWIGTYTPFIAPARQPLVWDNANGQRPPGYAGHPLAQPTVFPLSWGFDNEVLNSTVFHKDWPADEQILSDKGARLLPSGLDLADALGDRLAASLLRPQLKEYPHLGPALGRLRHQVDSGAAPVQGTIYGQWLAALKTQWSNVAPIPGAAATDALWEHKRLQTGLAAWATLRHTTILVNDESAAECGEGGFEELHTEPPRGYVEPDPATFSAIAGLFEHAAAFVTNGNHPWMGAWNFDDEPGYPANASLREGILSRLRDAAASARRFEAIADKEVRGEPLSSDDYVAILYAGRAGEYDFLVFKSLANKGYALSIPDPLPKIADVAGSDKTGYLLAAVGPGMEWDQVVPYFGRREIVKGSIYSYYELRSTEPITDQQWRAELPRHQPPGWIARFLLAAPLACPAPSPF